MGSGPAGLTMYPQFLCNWRVPSPAEVVQDLIPSPTYISVSLRLFSPVPHRKPLCPGKPADISLDFWKA